MIQFRNLTLHNFCSYGHSTINLQNRGFCLVSGINNYKKDNALSNGSGKSTWINAISACLTGETLNGLHSGFKNINIDEDLCYVSLEFNVDQDEFSILRQFNPKSDLKIIKNGEDISGKGIRDSEQILLEQLPDINKELLGSSILIGQGFPNKLTALTPAKRKELLENLTKTDFMIEDIKTRVLNRQTELSSKLRNAEDAILIKTTNLNSVSGRLDLINNTLKSLIKPDFDSIISNLTSELDLNTKEKNELEIELTSLQNELDKVNQELISQNGLKIEEVASLNKSFNENTTTIKSESVKLQTIIDSLKHEIRHLKSIVDVCPTCHQKLIGIEKPDYSVKEAELKSNEAKLVENSNSFKKYEELYKTYLSQINDKYAKSIETLNAQLIQLRPKINQLKTSISNNNTKINNLLVQIATTKGNMESWDSKLTELNNNKTELEIELNKLNSELVSEKTNKDDIVAHLNVIKKMETLIKRDYRGILLQNVINYLDIKSKEYCKIVFGTEEMAITLSGNNLDVSYCGKMVESLSGGERTKVDLILQLSIRNMLQSYLNMTSNILVLDEITDFLDKKSCNSIMTLIENELSTTESVFIISHMASDLEIPVDSELKVVKDINGISTIQ